MKKTKKKVSTGKPSKARDSGLESLSEDQSSTLRGTIEHFELHGSYPIAVTKESAKLLLKFLPDYLDFGKSSFNDRPISLTKKHKAVLPKELEVFMYKGLYEEYKKLFIDLDEKVYKFCREAGVL